MALLYSIGYEAQDTPDPEEGRETPKQLQKELDYFGPLLGWSDDVETVPLLKLRGLCISQALKRGISTMLVLLRTFNTSIHS